MKIIFFGLGSIGIRHAQILKKHYWHKLFAFRSGKSKSSITGIKQLHSWEEIKNIQPDIAFITNPTFLHVDTAIKCAQMNIKLFIEKPVGANLNKLDTLLKEVNKGKLVTYVGYNLRFHPVICYLKKYLLKRKVMHARICLSSYLPDWRPGKNHLKTYSASQALGGGVILDQSHEFDYLEYLFGEIKEIEGVSRRLSNVSVDSEDCLDAIIKTKTALVNMHANFFSQHTERTIEIDCPKEFIQADLINNSVTFFTGDKKKQISFKEGIPETYKKQMDYFFRNINNPQMMNNLPEATKLFKKIIKFKKESK